jgi:UDP-2,3-diacylglucosamine hydrolase
VTRRPFAEALFIADLHLAAGRAATTALFLDFVARRAIRADALYILGDLFDAWIGDDDRESPAQEVIAALRALTDAGVAVFLQRGNRDFLIGRRFERATGCRILPDPSRLDLYGQPTLLMHGDLLCTDDLDYQRVRRRLRNPLVQGLFLLRSLGARRRLAAEYRRRSGEATSLKAADIMDVNRHAVRGYMGRYGVRRLIHGHTHRPDVHRFELDGGVAERIVLGDWGSEQGPYVCLRPSGFEMGVFRPDP